MNDFNDLAANAGLNAVRAAVDAAGSVDVTPLRAALGAVAATVPANIANFANMEHGQGVHPAKPGAKSARTLSADASDFEWDALMPPPVAVPAMFHGPLGALALRAADGTEVNPVAAMAAMLTWFGTSVGRNRAIAVGDGRHHLNLFTLHVGRSSRGGKGMALDLLKRVTKAIGELDGGDAIRPQMHTGGLSTREGLAVLIHDGYRSGNEDIPAVNDKRLFVIEPEFANVLAQGKRDGNTLSTCLRDAWDGVSIKPATKSCRVWASRPHIGLHGCITPTELRAKLGSNDLTNGFANRFLVVWGERTGVVPFPARVPDAEVLGIAKRLTELIGAGLAGYPASDEVLFLKLTPDAKKLYADCYADFARPHPAGELIAGLLQRRAPMLLRIAGIFAVADGLDQVTQLHVEAARAWVEYSAQSVAMIFGPAIDAEGEAHLNEDAEKLLRWLMEAGDWRSRTAITSECFKGHLRADALNATLERLAIDCRIERREVASGPRKRTDYRAAQPMSARRSQPCSQAESIAVIECSPDSQCSQDRPDGPSPQPVLASEAEVEGEL